MDGKANGDVFGAEQTNYLGDSVLSLCHSHTIPDHLEYLSVVDRMHLDLISTYQNHAVSVPECIYSLINASFGDRALDLVVGLRSGGNTSEENIRKSPIHGNTLHSSGLVAGSPNNLSIHTMIYERIEPLTPIREPTVVSSGLSNMNPIGEMSHAILKQFLCLLPSATSAKPEYAFNTVMTTAAGQVSAFSHSTKQQIFQNACPEKNITKWFQTTIK